LKNSKHNFVYFMKKIKTYTLLICLAMTAAGIAATRMGAINVYIWKNGACKQILQNTLLYTTVGNIQSSITDGGGNIIWLWSNAACTQPAYFEP
jgi:hypothetical protein